MDVIRYMKYIWYQHIRRLRQVSVFKAAYIKLLISTAQRGYDGFLFPTIALLEL